MSTVFNFNRFCLLCKREIMEGRTLWLRNAMTCAVIALFFSLKSSGDFVFMAFLIFAAMSSSLLTEGLADRQKRIFYLTLPASSLEKFLSRFLYIMSFIFVAFPAAWVLGWGVQQVFSHFIFGDPWSVQFLSESIQKMRIEGSSFIGFAIHPSAPLSESIQRMWIEGNLWTFLLTLQAVCMLGSTIWLKNPFAKVILFHISFAVLVTMLSSCILYFYTIQSGDLVLGFWDSMNNGIGRSIISVIYVLIVILFYVLSYFRFKELGATQKLSRISPSLRIVIGCYLLLLVCMTVATVMGISMLSGSAVFFYRN